MNLCRPDTNKSCAACCGLYNVSDGTRPTLHEKLADRTDRFQEVKRTPDALSGFECEVRAREKTPPHDEAIHVCEFTGFVDAERRSVGCMLHPSAPGNEGIDLRGMCHYGSMACKSFYCPAWNELSLVRAQIITETVPDWHLYGLVITDADFVCSLFELLEERLDAPVDQTFVKCEPARSAFLEMLKWKDSRFLCGDSTVRLRLGRYYISVSASRESAPGCGPMDRILNSLRFTFGNAVLAPGAETVVSRGIDGFVRAYGEWLHRQN
ncbi:MAG: hypothetical protein V1792_15410 [Pseudomonadota bacterium]